ncbi:MAG: histidine kinase [Ferruginibacter sp.]
MLIQIIVRSFLIAFVLCCVNSTVAQKKTDQPSQYIFTTYTASDGLLSSEILTVAFDQKGFLWAGTTAGLSRYDGYTFSNFTRSDDNHFIGTVNVIKAVADKLWIGASSGLYCYSDDRLIKISTETAASLAVNDMIVNDDGSLWLATDVGPAFLTLPGIDPTGTQKIFLKNYVLKQWISDFANTYDSQCLFIRDAPDGSIYFATHFQIFSYINKHVVLVHTNTTVNDQIECIIPVNSTKVFCNAAMTGLGKIQEDVFTQLYFKKLYQPGRVSKTTGTWYTGSLGIVCFHPDEEFISNSINFQESGASWLSFIVKKDHIFWLATHNGLIKITPAAFNLYKDKKFSDIDETFSFCELKDGTFLMGGNHGNIYKVTDESVNNFLPAGNKVVPNAEVKCMYEDERGWLWIGTGYQGIVLYRNGKMTRFNEKAGQLHDNSFSSFLPSKNGKLYAIGDKGMSEIVVDEKENISIKPYFSPPRITKYSKFYGGIQAPDGTVWIGGEEGLRYLRNDSLISFSLTESMMNIRSIKLAKDNMVWLATAGDGIISCRFNEKNKLQLVKQYDEKDGLNTKHFLDVFIDKEENIWAGSVKGLTFIGRNDQHKEQLINFSTADGFIKPGYYSCKIYQDVKDNIWVGTTQGITSFAMDDLNLTATPPNVYLTELEFLKESKNNISRTILLSNNQQEISLPFNDNSLNFSYTAANYAGPEAIQYYYNMDGLDTNWMAAGSRRSIAYYSIPAGSYTFRVKAINDKGVWSTTDCAVSFTIHPPFWQTAWFKIICLLVVAAVIFLIVKKRERTIARQEAEKTAVEKIKANSYQYQLEIEQVINFFAVSIHQHNTIDDTLWNVAKNLIGKLGFEDCMIYLWNKDKTVLVQKAGYGIKGSMLAEMDKDKYNVPKGKGIVGATVESKNAILVNDTAADARYFSVDDNIRLSELCVPIIHQKEVMGALNTEHTEKNFYTVRHLQILTTIASMLADRIYALEAQQHAREKEIEVLELNKNLASSQLTALRSQMNPHFLFNAMNSIQQFTLTGDMDNANLYISKFAALLRKVLQSSKLSYLSLEEEIEQLNLYLDIEQLRLGKGFTYSIETDPDIEADACKIPGMLLQPFVENSIKHGLALKEGERKLQIQFILKDDTSVLAVITDNGIGRKKAGEIKAGQQKFLPHESKGIELIKERMQLLSQSLADEIIIFEDIVSSDGKPLGTKVTLVLPLLNPTS